MKLSAKAKESLEKVVEKFKSGDLSPVVKMARIELPEDAPAAKWSFSNRILAFAQTGSLDCRGFAQWKQTGRMVKKGPHGNGDIAWILFPRLKKVEDDDGERMVLYGFGSIHVFPYHSTEGDDIDFQYKPKKMPPLMDVAERLGLDVKWGPMVMALGSCDTKGEELNLGTHDPSVFFHELAHACHARLNGGLKGGQDAEQETVAEFSAAVLMELYGHDYTGNAWRYVASYNNDPLKAMMKALSTVEKVLEVVEGKEKHDLQNVPA